MALIFPRLARNFVKNGYYPTDSVTLGRIVDSLKFSGSKTRILTRVVAKAAHCQQNNSPCLSIMVKSKATVLNMTGNAPGIQNNGSITVFMAIYTIA